MQRNNPITYSGVKRKIDSVNSDEKIDVAIAQDTLIQELIPNEREAVQTDRFIASRSHANNELANWRLESVSQASLPRNENLLHTYLYKQALSHSLFNQPISNGPNRKIRFTQQHLPSRKMFVAQKPAQPIRSTWSHLLTFAELDAPSAQDDFYCNYIDWGNSLLSVGLGDEIYLWNGNTKDTTQLDHVTYANTSITRNAVHQAHFSDRLIAGTSQGCVEYYDMIANKHINTFQVSYSNILTIQSYQPHVFAVGSRSGNLILIDDRVPTNIFDLGNISNVSICGLATNKHLIAAGYGNDTVEIWDPSFTRRPITIFRGHQASVKAIQFSPTHRNHIATASGIRDHTVNLWNVQTGEVIHRFTPFEQSQRPHITSLNWTGSSENELAITIGNEIQLWGKFNNELGYLMMQKKSLGKNINPSNRIICASKQRGGNLIACVSSSEVLQIWSLFNPSQNKKVAGTSTLSTRLTIR